MDDASILCGGIKMVENIDEDMSMFFLHVHAAKPHRSMDGSDKFRGGRGAVHILAIVLCE